MGGDRSAALIVNTIWSALADIVIVSISYFFPGIQRAIRCLGRMYKPLVGTRQKATQNAVVFDWLESRPLR